MRYGVFAWDWEAQREGLTPDGFPTHKMFVEARANSTGISALDLIGFSLTIPNIHEKSWEDNCMLQLIFINCLICIHIHYIYVYFVVFKYVILKNMISNMCYVELYAMNWFTIFFQGVFIAIHCPHLPTPPCEIQWDAHFRKRNKKPRAVNTKQGRLAWPSGKSSMCWPRTSYSFRQPFLRKSSP